jgi:uncharacterized protein YuzE
MRVTYDPEVDAAYVSLIPAPSESAVNTLVSPVAELSDVNLDFEIAVPYRFIGMEFFGASDVLPAMFLQQRYMTLTYRRQTGTAYLSLVPGSPATMQRRLPFQDPEDPHIGPFRIAFDLDESRQLIGVEIQDAGRWLTEESLKSAKIIDG